jgi:hypothetical protein
VAAYDSSRFSPPAPVAQVTLRNPDTGLSLTDLPMLLDTGADVSLIPAFAADAVGLTRIQGKEYELEGFAGSLSTAVAAMAEVQFCRRVFRGQFLILDQPLGILGRNILNALPLVLHGPRLEWKELQG